MTQESNVHALNLLKHTGETVNTVDGLIREIEPYRGQGLEIQPLRVCRWYEHGTMVTVCVVLEKSA